MVQFYNGLELSKRLNVSYKERERAYEFVTSLYEDLKQNELNQSKISLKYPLFKTGMNLFLKGGSRENIEKYLYYHILSSDYHGYRFIESLLIAETLLSHIEDEHPFLTYNKLLSYLGEEFIFSKNTINEIYLFFSRREIDYKIEDIFQNRGTLDLQKSGISGFKNLNDLQMEYILLDLNPKIISAGLDSFPIEESKKIFDIYSTPQKELILRNLNNNIPRSELKTIIERRIRGEEKNSFELRRQSTYYNRLFKGEELAYRLKINFKLKHNLREIITILLGVAGTIYQKGLRGSREILEAIQNEELDFLKLGLIYLLEGCHPTYIRILLENYILVSDYRGIEFVKRYIILDGILSLALRHSEYAMLEKFIQTIGEDFRQIIESYIDEVSLQS